MPLSQDTDTHFLPDIRVNALWLARKTNKRGSVIYYPICKLEPLIRHTYIKKKVKKLLKKKKAEICINYLAAISIRL